MPAPIVLFVYNRPIHTLKVLNALAQNDLFKESTLYIYSDGPKDRRNDTVNVQEVRNIIRAVDFFDKVIIFESSYNKGLAVSIIDGVTSVLQKHSSVIVLEDDVVPSKWFLQYMNRALKVYEKDTKVMHINGYLPPVEEKLPLYFFTGLMQCWGWATWDRAWNKFTDDTEYLYSKINSLDRVFLFDGSTHGFFVNQLKDNISGRKKTWAIKWYASIFLDNGYCLSTGISMTHNIGADGSGENVKFDEVFDTITNTKELI